MRILVWDSAFKLGYSPAIFDAIFIEIIPNLLFRHALVIMKMI